jgi:hypothetical protein
MVTFCWAAATSSSGAAAAVAKCVLASTSPPTCADKSNPENDGLFSANTGDGIERNAFASWRGNLRSLASHSSSSPSS